VPDGGDGGGTRAPSRAERQRHGRCALARPIRCQPSVVADSLGRLELSPSGDVLVAGGLSGACSLFGAPEAATAGYDAWATRLAAADGAPSWSYRYGDDSFQTAHKSDGLVLAGVAGGTIDFGNGVALTSGSESSPIAPAFVAVLTDDGAGRFVRMVGEPLADLTVAADGSGGALVGVKCRRQRRLGAGAHYRLR